MPPKPICSCNLHKDTDHSTGKKPQNIEKSKKFKKTVRSFLVEKGRISARAKYLCKSCYDEEERLCENNKCNKRTNLERYTSNEFCELIAKDELDENEVGNIASALGKYLNVKLRNQFDKDYNIREKLENLTFDSKLCNYDSALNEYLVSLSASNKSNAALLNADDSLVYLVNKKYIGKLNFSLSLIFHFITGSKSIVELRSRYSPSGSYTTLPKYLETYSTEKLRSVARLPSCECFHCS